jgi:COP9 signalosome complex subunit 1
MAKVLCPADVAVYGGLCALASFNRQELKSKVLDNTEFRQFLEIEPQMREVIHFFYHSHYHACLSALEKWKVQAL